MPVSAGMTAVPEANPVAQESVITTTLNSYAEQSGVARFALVEIDAEGHDLVVLRGAWSSIPGWDADPETFVEGSYLACHPEAAAELPAVTWLKPRMRRGPQMHLERAA